MTYYVTKTKYVTHYVTRATYVPVTVTGAQVTKTVDGVTSVTQLGTITRRQTLTYTVTKDQLATQSNEFTAYVTEVVTKVIVVDVTETATQFEDQTTVLTELNTAYITDTELVDVDISTTVTQTEDVTTTATERTIDTAIKVDTVDVTDYETVLQTSSTTITVTQPATLYTTVTSTVDVTKTQHITKTVDVTVTQTISTTTTETVTATTTQPAPTCGFNKIVNGGFNSQTLAPWTFSSNYNGYYQYVAGSLSPYAIALITTPYSIGSSAIISQSFSTIPAKMYQVNFAFYIHPDNNSPGTLICESSVPGYLFSASLNFNKGVWYSGGFQFPAISTFSSISCRITSSYSTKVYLDEFYVGC